MKLLSNVNVIFLSDRIMKRNTKLIKFKSTNVCLNAVQKNDTFSDMKIRSAKIDNSVLFFSNLMLDKGIIDFIKAVKELRKIRPNLQVVVAGDIEPSNKKTINALLTECSDFVVYHGAISDVQQKEKILMSSKVFCLPSYDEGVPLAIIEAYSYGCNVVTTEVGGVPDIFSDKVNGYYAEAGNIESLVIALNLALDSDFFMNNIHEFNSKFTFEHYAYRINGIVK